MLIEHLEISVCNFNIDCLSRYYVSFPAELKSLILFCEPDAYSRADSRWNRLRREAVILFADSCNFNVLEDLSGDVEEVAFGMRYEPDLSQSKNRGEVIMLKPYIGTYHGTVRPGEGCQLSVGI